MIDRQHFGEVLQSLGPLNLGSALASFATQVYYLTIYVSNCVGIINSAVRQIVCGKSELLTYHVLDVISKMKQH